MHKNESLHFVCVITKKLHMNLRGYLECPECPLQKELYHCQCFCAPLKIHVLTTGYSSTVRYIFFEGTCWWNLRIQEKTVLQVISAADRLQLVLIVRTGFPRFYREMYPSPVRLRIFLNSKRRIEYRIGMDCLVDQFFQAKKLEFPLNF